MSSTYYWQSSSDGYIYKVSLLKTVDSKRKIRILECAYFTPYCSSFQREKINHVKEIKKDTLIVKDINILKVNFFKSRIPDRTDEYENRVNMLKELIRILETDPALYFKNLEWLSQNSIYQSMMRMQK